MSTPLVVLHGMLGAPESFGALRRAMRPRQIIGPTLPGHGPTPSPVAPTFELAADALAEWLSPRAPFDVLGYSLGARLALAMCARHPKLFRRALLVSVHPGLPSEAARTARREQDEQWAALVARSGVPALVDAWEDRPIFASQQDLPAQVIAAQRTVRLAHTSPGIAAALRGLGLGTMPDLAPALERLCPRVRLVVGGRDEKFVALADGLRARIPSLGIDHIDACGHNPLAEAPARLAALADSFFALAPGTPRATQSMEPTP